MQILPRVRKDAQSSSYLLYRYKLKMHWYAIFHLSNSEHSKSLITYYACKPVS